MVGVHVGVPEGVDKVPRPQPRHLRMGDDVDEPTNTNPSPAQPNADGGQKGTRRSSRSLNLGTVRVRHRRTDG